VGGGSNGNAMSGSSSLARHWGPERSVPITRDPTQSLGISIVGGKVDMTNGSGAPITGIFIKNVLGNSPAGKTNQLRTGDRILEVDGENLRNASHERAVEVIRKAGNPVKFLVQSLIGDTTSNNGPSGGGVASRYLANANNNNSSNSNNNNNFNAGGARKGPEVIQAGGKAPVKRSTTIDDDDGDLDQDMSGRTVSAAGIEIDRASAANTKVNSDEDTPDDFGYTPRKIQKRWGRVVTGELIKVDLDRPVTELGGMVTSLGISLAGHKDRSMMAAYICGINPNGLAAKEGRLNVGDELIEISGNVLHGRCHLNASAVIKGVEGKRVAIIVARRPSGVKELAVKPLSRFPAPLKEPTLKEKYSKYKNLRLVTVKKGPAGLGIMIIEGKQADIGSGIFVSDIQANSCADLAGIIVGDVILEVNNDPLLGANYEKAASVLKLAEGMLSIVVCNPKDGALEAAAARKAGGLDPKAKPEPKKKEPPADPANCEVKPGKETVLEINKDKLGLGLSIVGGSDTLLGAILIHEVYPDGAAAKDKRLKPGDQILDVNGESFRSVTHTRALTVLRQTPAKVKMTVFRDESCTKEDDIMLDLIDVELMKKSGRGLGLSIVGRRNGPGVYISDVVKGGAAEADGRLMQGDQILNVNGSDLRTASQEQAAALLKTAMGKIDLKIGRLKAGAKK